MGSIYHILHYCYCMVGIICGVSNREFIFKFMIQEIIVHIIVLAALAYSLFNLVKLFLPGKKRHGQDCAGCNGCELKNIHSRKEIDPTILSIRR